MPELPEVESIRRSLEPRLVGRRVLGVRLLRRDVVIAPGDPFGGVTRQRGPRRTRATPRRLAPGDLLEGTLIAAIRRHGKQLAIVGERTDGLFRAVVVQLGMTGQLLHRATDRRPRLPPAPDGSHVHAVWEFDHGRVLFRDPRRFGALRVFASTAALDEHWAGLGPDALTITADQLAAALRGSARPVKAALLDQAVVAGVGNIYADEALFAAGVRPTRLCRNLRDAQIQAIASSIRAVLAGAVQAGGSTLRDYVDGDGNPGSYQRSHAVYGRAGEPCPRCGRPLKSVTVAQRTTVWCSACQR